MSSCIFCKIIEGTIPAKRVYEDELVIAIEDIAPVAPVHLLLIPRRHFINALDMENGDIHVVGHIYKVAAELARKHGIAEKGFRVVNNNNADAGQSVFHVHFHLIGGRHMAWPPG